MDAAGVVVLANKHPWRLGATVVAIEIRDHRACPVTDRNRPIHTLIATDHGVTGDARLTGNRIGRIQYASEQQFVGGVVVAEVHHEPAVVTTVNQIHKRYSVPAGIGALAGDFYVAPVVAGRRGWGLADRIIRRDVHGSDTRLLRIQVEVPDAAVVEKAADIVDRGVSCFAIAVVVVAPEEEQRARGIVVGNVRCDVRIRAGCLPAARSQGGACLSRRPSSRQHEEHADDRAEIATLIVHATLPFIYCAALALCSLSKIGS